MHCNSLSFLCPSSIVSFVVFSDLHFCGNPSFVRILTDITNVVIIITELYTCLLFVVRHLSLMSCGDGRRKFRVLNLEKVLGRKVWFLI
jgi:hypothetical protein